MAVDIRVIISVNRINNWIQKVYWEGNGSLSGGLYRRWQESLGMSAKKKEGILSSYIWLHLGNYEYVVLQRVYVTRRWRRNGKGKREEGRERWTRERYKKKREKKEAWATNTA